MDSNTDATSFKDLFRDIKHQLNHFTDRRSVRGETVNISDVLNISHQIDKLMPITEEEKLQQALLRIWVLSSLDKHSEALLIFNQTVEKTLNNNTQLDLLIQGIFELTNVLRRHDRLTEAISVVEEGERRLKKVEKKDEHIWKRLATLMRSKGRAYWQKGDNTEAYNCWKKALEIQKKLGDKEQIAGAQVNLGVLLRERGDYKSALEYYNDALVTFRKIGNKKHIGVVLNNIGNLYRDKGELELAFECLKESLTIWEELGDRYGIASALHNIGEILQNKGELIEALEYFQRCLALDKELEANNKDMAQAHENIGKIYFARGELNLALEYYQNSLHLREELGHEQHIACSNDNIGLIYQAQGVYKEAFECFMKALTIKHNLGNKFQIAETLYNFVILTVEHDALEEAKRFLNQLASLDTSSRVISQRYRLAKAMVLKNSTRLQKKVEAQNIFHEIAYEDIVKHDLTVIAMLNLCEMLLFELNLMKGEESSLLDEVKDLSNQLLAIAKSQNSFSLLVRTYLLQSKLSLLELNVHEAELLLGQARLMSEENGLYRLAIVISSEVEKLFFQLTKWEELISRNAPILERVELAQVNQIIKQMIQKRVEDVSHLPQFAVELIRVSLFKLDINGPKLVVSESLPYTKSDSELLMKMGLFYTFSLKQGNSMKLNIGLFGPLPVPTVPDHIGMTFTFSILDPKRTNLGSNNELYAVIVFSLPRSLEHFFKDRNKISQKMEKQTRGLKMINEVTFDFLQSLKYHILEIEKPLDSIRDN